MMYLILNCTENTIASSRVILIGPKNFGKKP